MLGSKMKKHVTALPSIYFFGPTVAKSPGKKITVADIIFFYCCISYLELIVCRILIVIDIINHESVLLYKQVKSTLLLHEAWLVLWSLN